MFKSRRRQDQAIVGLEMDPSHLAAAEVHVNGKLTVKKGGVAHLRPGILRDGEVADVAALADALRALFSDNELGTHVRLGVANQRIVVRTLDLPLVEDDAALAAAVQAAAPDNIPVPMDEAVLDFQTLGPVETPAGPRTRVVVVAVRRDMIERMIAATQEAGLTVEGVDLSAFGMVRALRAGESEHAVLYVNVAGLINVAVADDRGCLFTRAAAGGLDAITQTLCERRGLTMEHARGWMQHVGLERDVASVEGDPELVGAVRQILEEGVHHVADSVRNSLNFYRMQDSAEAVDHAVLTGPAVLVPGFAEQLSRELGMPVAPMVVEVDAESADAGRLTVAAGLALADAA
jgi:type IV pilus assembly protein PilM